MLFSVAQPLLSEHGEFYPFGAVMLQDGEFRHVSAKIEGDNDPQSLIDLLTQTFQKEAGRGRLRAAGICCDVLVISPGKD